MATPIIKDDRYVRLVDKALAGLGFGVRYFPIIAVYDPATDLTSVAFSVESVTGWYLPCSVMETDVDRLGATAAVRQVIRDAVSKTSAEELAKDADPALEDSDADRDIWLDEAQDFIDKVKKRVGL